ncbi:MAG: zf-HC2 domain-containing protein [Rhodocyclaceae bacterium]|nr:zf-HC2 domain-containing protein [Rhodocyclaceae bacterium]
MTISDELLNAYLDNELSDEDRARILAAIAADEALRQRACALWQIKQMVRGAYPLSREEKRAMPPSSRSLWRQALAASLMFCWGALAGWFAHGQREAEEPLVAQIEALRKEGGRALVHLVSDEPARVEKALALVERLAHERDRQGRPFRIEFIANGPGLRILLASASPFAERIMALAHHDNVRLLACREAMNRLRARGVEVTLLPGVEEAVSAESELALRLTQGWRYLQS